MKNQMDSEQLRELQILCIDVKRLILQHDTQESEKLIISAMCRYPHAPQPHNLMGILLEEQQDHLTAMKHFRAAWSLDPTYTPASENLACFGNLFSDKKYAFDEADCLPVKINSTYTIAYDEKGIGHVVKESEM